MPPEPEPVAVDKNEDKEMLVTHAGAPAERLPSAGASFIAALGIPATLLRDKWVPESGQATDILLDAIARSDGTRASVARELKIAHVTGGILGDFHFDANGDIDPALFSLYCFHAGKEELTGTIAVPGELTRKASGSRRFRRRADHKVIRGLSSSSIGLEST